MAVVQLGGHPVTFRTDEVGIDVREPLADIARVLSGYHAAPRRPGVRPRACSSSWPPRPPIPVVNLLSDAGHPCQALADLLTMQRASGATSPAARSPGSATTTTWPAACASARPAPAWRVRIACPAGYGPTDVDVERLLAAGLAERAVRHRHGPTRRPRAPTPCTPTSGRRWARRPRPRPARRAFEGFTVDDAVMAAAAADAVFLHCLPAHRGEEVAASVVDGPQSRRVPAGPQPAARLPGPAALPAGGG